MLAAACSAPPLPADLARAQAHERAGRHEAALSAYRDAARSCRQVEDERRRLETCASAYLQRAELLISMERRSDAVVAYEDAARAMAGFDRAVAEAHYQRGRLLLSLERPKEAYGAFWTVIRDFPDEPFAADAIKVLLADGRRRNAQQLSRAFADLLVHLEGTAVADNILYALADLAEHELGQPGAALAYYDAIDTRYAKGPFRDDALWHGARLSRQLGDSAGAARRLRALLDMREVAWGTGSYFSVRLDDAQLALGRILRDDLGQGRAAIDAFTQLPELYPDSVYHDDALYERAVTWAALGDTGRACADLADLAARFPDSKYELPDHAPARRAQLGCTGAAE